MASYVEMSINDMDPALRAMVAYEPNDALDIVHPQQYYTRALRETPAIRWEGGVALFRFDDILEAGRNPAIVSTNPATGCPFGMGSREPLIPIHVDGDEHRRFRRLLDPLLAPKQMAHLEPEVRRLAHEHIDRFIVDGRVEFHDQFALPLPGQVFLTLFGLPLEDFDVLSSAKDAILKNDGATLDEKERLGIEAGDRLRSHLALRLDERRRTLTPSDHETSTDLIGQFLTFEVDGERLSDAQILNIVHLFAIAGLDTVTASLSCLVGWFARNPAQRDLVVADPTLLPGAIEELMRFESPVLAGGGRWATRDTVVNGVPVNAGEMVVLVWAAGNHDTTAFAAPEVVDLARTANKHMAFAVGLHRCLGSHLARLELRAALGALHERIPDYHLTPGEVPQYHSAGVRAATYLPLTFTPGSSRSIAPTARPTAG